MKRKQIPCVTCMAVLALFWFSCASIPRSQDITSYEDRIRHLTARIVRDPNDGEARRDLGVILVQTRRFAQAERQLFAALQTDSTDGKTRFYYGLSLEYQNKRDSALAVYLYYDCAPALSPYRRLMRGRYEQLTREIITEQVRDLVAKEDSLSDGAISPVTVAVYPLVYRGTHTQYESLGRGLSEMILIDLARVPSLRLVERVRLEALSAELKLGKSAAVDLSTAPRLGRLLKAGRIVSGAYDVVGNSDLRLDVGFWQVQKKQQQPKVVAKSDAIDNLFRLEKELVFDIIAKMGIRLTPVEREKILLVPTANIQAFMSYCMGLESEDALDFRGAALHFDDAARLDQGFSLAQTKKGAMQALVVGGGRTAQAHAVATSVDPKIPIDHSDLVIDRLQSLQTSIGSGFIPGADSRKPAEESHGSGAAIGPLPEPPTPPGN
jgi:TolB-like protein